MSFLLLASFLAIKAEAEAGTELSATENFDGAETVCRVEGAGLPVDVDFCEDGI